MANDEDPSLLSRNNIESFGTKCCGEGPAAIGGGPGRADHVGDIGQLHALPGESLPLRRRGGRDRLVRIGPVGGFQPVGDIGPAVRPEPAHAGSVMAAERGGLAQLELRQSHGRLHPNLLEACGQDLTVRADAANDEVQVAATLAALPGLVVVDEGGLVILRTEVAQNELSGLPELVPGHVA